MERGAKLGQGRCRQELRLAKGDAERSRDRAKEMQRGPEVGQGRWREKQG